MDNQLWVTEVGNIIVARVRGVPTQGLLRECHQRISKIIEKTGRDLVLYDGLEMEAPSVEVTFEQWKLDSEICEHLPARRAVVVANDQLAYLARIAFARSEHRVFCNDLVEAINWLNEKE